MSSRALARSLVLDHFQWIDGDADTWSMLRDADALRAISDGLAELLRSEQIDYRGKRQKLTIRSDHFHDGQRVVLIDDWIETGSQAKATAELISSTGASLVAIAVVIDETPSDVKASLPPIQALVLGEELP